jgi:hypothetical protein
MNLESELNKMILQDFIDKSEKALAQDGLLTPEQEVAIGNFISIIENFIALLDLCVTENGMSTAAQRTGILCVRTFIYVLQSSDGESDDTYNTVMEFNKFVDGLVTKGLQRVMPGLIDKLSDMMANIPRRTGDSFEDAINGKGLELLRELDEKYVGKGGEKLG